MSPQNLNEIFPNYADITRAREHLYKWIGQFPGNALCDQVRLVLAAYDRLAYSDDIEKVNDDASGAPPDQA